jgi:hypothetical protein
MMTKDYTLRELWHDLGVVGQKISADIAEWIGSMQASTLLIIIGVVVALVMFVRFLMNLWFQDPRLF